MIEEWLNCPFCDGEHQELGLFVDGEHVAVECGHCQSVFKMYHGGMQNHFGPLYEDEDGD